MADGLDTPRRINMFVLCTSRKASGGPDRSLPCFVSFIPVNKNIEKWPLLD